ncbi:MAG TPA: aldehyde dehydrogenase family protein [Xanthobacteraceae bacterium]|jgi:acyl-CoA reductase-like NAD-dependent aldehyde dehydrogenase
MNLHAQPMKAHMLIGGELVAGEANNWLDSVNPANEEKIGEVPAGDAADVNKAVAAAEKAQPAWAALDIKQRGKYLHKLAKAIRERADELLQTEVIDTGNTITKMKVDIEGAAEALEWYTGLAIEMKGETVPASSKHLHITVREPYGVAARIVPFNHPLSFAVRGLAGPLIAGNTVVVKPPETSSLSASILAEMSREIMPPGTVNIVTGNGMPAGDAIVRHPKVKRIAFTGSVPTGMLIQRAAAESGIKALTLELGGKNPFIVYPDADAEKVADAAIAGMNFAWSGQSCGSTSRLMLHESLYKKVIDRITERVAEIKVGDPLDPKSQMGPMNSKRQLERVNSMIQSGVKDGAKLMVGGKRPSGKDFERGYWVEPTVFGDVHPQMRIAREEIFGPVLSVFSWRDEDATIELANSVEYGLTAAIWTNDIKRALNAARKIQSGMVWVNGVGNHFKGTPYGGYKNSGVGRESCLEELLSYTEVKTIQIFL